MRKAAALCLVLSVLLMSSRTVKADVTASPSSLSVPRGRQTISAITYRITSPGCARAVSTSGEFVTGQSVLGVVDTTLSIPLTGGATTSGTVSETLIIPVGVIQRAENLGVNRFEYRRRFDLFIQQQPCATFNSSIQITVTSEAVADFRITRLRLYFENRRAEITVKLNEPALKAYADIRYAGSGFLRGFWEVDGRILSYVNRHLVYGRSVTLETPTLPPLPTFVTGTHVVRFVITSPQESPPLPAAVYFVTAEEFREIYPIALIDPADEAEAAYSPVTFRWSGKDPTAVYLIELFEDRSEEPVFSAYTRKTEYTTPLPVLRGMFSPERGYRWGVKAFDSEGLIAGESPTYNFTFTERSSYVPGQIVIVTESSGEGVRLTEEIRRKYHLRLIEGFDVQSLGLRVSVFQTEAEIFRLTDAIIKEKGVVLAQPNYVFRTMADPMSHMQIIYRVMNLGKLHKFWRGKGVTVAVIDTGVDRQHADLGDSLTCCENLIEDCPFQAEIHGTAVAGIIGASLNGFGIAGVAPEGEILALRACRQISDTHPEGECYSASITKALDISILRHARVVNMSFGSASPDRLITKLIEEGARRGILFVSPAGNVPHQRDLAFPASHPDVIAVAGIDDDGDPYPNREIASKALVCAPAANVFTTIPGNNHNFLTGTSMASAIVAGVLVLATEKNGAVDRKRIPAYGGDPCQWVEQLLTVSLCEDR